MNEVVCKFEMVKLGELQYCEVLNNVEVEQVLLGVIFMNNDVFYCVLDFFKFVYFYEGLYCKIFEVVGDIICMGKIVNLVMIKMFLVVDDCVGDMMVV